MRTALLSLAALAGLAGLGIAAPSPARAQPWVQEAQFYGGPPAYYGGGPGWREREWRRHEWERHRRWEEQRRWHHWHERW